MVNIMVLSIVYVSHALTKEEGWCQEGHLAIQSFAICNHMVPSLTRIHVPNTLWISGGWRRKR